MKTTNSYRTKKSYLMKIDGEPDQIFPLLCPVREYEWIEPWKCKMIYSKSGFAELGAVFTTDFPDDGPTDTWVVSRYEPNIRIEFVRTNPLRTIHYSIVLNHVDINQTEALWEQEITALSPEGEKMIKEFTDEEFRNEMIFLEQMLNHFVMTGEMLKLSEIK